MGKSAQWNLGFTKLNSAVYDKTYEIVEQMLKTSNSLSLDQLLSYNCLYDLVTL